jgi:hypothetical protein
MDTDVPEHIATRIISQRELEVEGVVFQWWAVGDGPALVTVRAKIFGSRSNFTDEDVAEFAAALAKSILVDHYARAADNARKAAKTPALKKPGWFEPGCTDYSSTIF